MLLYYWSTKVDSDFDLFCHIRHILLPCLSLRLLHNDIFGIFNCVQLFQHTLDFSSKSPLSSHLSNKEGEAEKAWSASLMRPIVGLTNQSKLLRAGSVKDLITRFSGRDTVPAYSMQQSFCLGPEKVLKTASIEPLNSPKSTSSPPMVKRAGQEATPVPSIVLTPFRETTQNGLELTKKASKASPVPARIKPPVEGVAPNSAPEPRSKSEAADSGRDSLADSGMGSVRHGEQRKSWCPSLTPLHEWNTSALFLLEDVASTWHQGFVQHFHAWCCTKHACWHESMKPRHSIEARTPEWN